MKFIVLLLKMLGASVISSLFVSIIFFMLVLTQSLSESFSMMSLKGALALSVYALMVSLIIIVVFGILLASILILIKKLNFKYISSIGFLVGFLLLYTLLNGRFSNNYKIDIYSYLFCVLFGLVSAATACVFYKTFTMLKKKDNNVKI